MNALAPCNVADLLAKLDALGIQLEADGERLRFRPREAVTADLAARMKAHKGELRALLATRKTAGRLLEVVTTWRADWRDQWEERAAIVEYDGNMPRPPAEDWAFHLLLSAVLAEQGIGYAPGSIPTADLLGVK
jgi:hypothetical protein